MPYISASIIMQLCTVVVPSLEALKKEGEAGRRKITQVTRYATLGAGVLPGARHRDRAGAAGGSRARAGPGVPIRDVGDARYRHHVPDVAGRADHRARARQRHLAADLRGHCRRAASAIGQTLEQLNTGPTSIPLVLGIAILVVAVHGLRRLRRARAAQILVNYAKRQVGNKVYQGQSSHLPLKLNMAA